MISKIQKHLFILIAGAWLAAISPAVAASSTAILSTNLLSPPGSGDATKPGFTVRVNQTDLPIGASDLAGLTSRAEQQLSGIIATNSADLSGATNGVFIAPGIINWNEDVGAGGAGIEIGNFTSLSDPSRPDEPVPGIPGVGPNSLVNGGDNFSVELITYIEFKTAGLYTMGVNSDEGFKVTSSDQAPTQKGALLVTGGSAAGSYFAVSGDTNGGGISRPITTPIPGKVVYAQPPDSCGGIINVSDIRGNIALIDRGTCTFTDKILNAKAAGAKAVIVVNNLDADDPQGPYPFIMTGDLADLPAVMISKPDGAKIKTALTGGAAVNVTLTADSEPRLGEFNGVRTASDTIFSFTVPAAGVYPFRAVWFENSGTSSFEWFSVLENGTKIPLNDPENPDALQTFRARTGAPVEASNLTIAPSGNGSITITWDHSGKLQETTELRDLGTDWTDTPDGGTSPVTLGTTSSAKFYRVLAQ